VGAVDLIGDVGRLEGWLPVDAVVKDGRPGVVWLDMRGRTLDEPLLCQTVARIRRDRGQSPARFTPLATLIEFEKTTPGLAPTGFIFHSSRCGSTLVANACRALTGARVIAEPCAVDKLVGRFFTDVNDDPTRELVYSVLLRAAVHALGQPRLETETRYFVKFSCVSVLQVRRIRRIWPAVPSVFIYRDPVEVVVSNLADPPAWMRVDAVPAMATALLGASPHEIGRMSRAEVCARAVGRFYGAAHDGCDETTRFIDYSELSAAALSSVVGHFGIRPTAAETDAMVRTLAVSAKDPDHRRPFVADGEAKRAAASREVQAMVDRWARAPYLRLEARRRAETRS